MHPKFIPLEYRRPGVDEQRREARRFLDVMKTRRSVRHFSADPVPYDIIEQCIRAAGLAPSGANQQPWRFVVVSDPDTRHRIRVAAEKEERDNYEHRFPGEWKDVLEPLGTVWHKEFLDDAPYLIVVFQITYGIAGSDQKGGGGAPESKSEAGKDQSQRRPGKIKHYYVTESVGIATGFLIAALHHAGLCTVTHTPNPMGFLNRILNRPKNEKPYVLLPVGYPAADVHVPDIRKKDLSDILIHVR